MEFLVQIGSAIGDEEFMVTVTDPQGGSVSGRFVLPVDDQGQPLYALDWWYADLADAEKLGDTLFQALFKDKVGDHWRGSCGAADNTRERLNLSIELDPGQPGVAPLLNMPWELLFDRNGGGFIALGWRRSVCRHVRSESPLFPPLRPSVLRILGAIADPRDLWSLDVESELRSLEQAGARRALEIQPIRPADLKELMDPFADSDVQILHYIGHGDFDEERERGELIFCGKDGYSNPVDAHDLGAALAGIDSLRLVMLNACSTARTPSSPTADPFAGVAAALVKAGVPAVVAMQLPIGDCQAITFAATLYKHLFAGYPLEHAMTLARRSLWHSEPESIAWAIPALFSRVHETVLFAPAVPDGTTRRALGHYLESVVTLHRDLDLPSPSWMGAPTVPFAELFIEPLCRRQVPGASQPEPAAPFDQVTGQERHFAILGGAGSGKTTLLRRLAVGMAGRACESLEESVVPVLVRAADLAAERRQSRSPLGICLGRCLSSGNGAGAGVLAEIIPDLIDTGRAALLIDGLDEVGDPATRRDLLRELRRLADEPASGGDDEVPGNQLIVTSRTATWSSPREGGITTVMLEPFGPAEIERFLAAWSALLGGPADLGERIREVEQQQGGGGLTSSPWLLSLLCGLLQQGRGRSPRCRAELYQLVIDTLLEKPSPLPEDTFQLLVDIAASALNGDGQVDAQQVQRLIERRIPQRDDLAPATLRRALLEQSGLLVPLGEGFFQFRHTALQEYLAARFLAPQIRDSVNRLIELLSTPLWREPLRMAIGCVGLELDEASLRGWLRSLITSEDPQGPGAPRPILFLAATLAELPRVPQGIVEELVERLVSCASSADGRSTWQPPVEAAFVRLLEGEHAAEARDALAAALRSGESSRALAAARLMRSAGRLAGEAVDALPGALRHDEDSLDRPVETALRDLAARDPDRLPDQSRSLRAVLLRRQDLVRKVLEDPAWLRLVLAVYGGFAPGSGFAAKLIHRDSPLLTHHILGALERNAETLVPDIERLLASVQKPGTSFDAALALLALQGSAALDKIPEGLLLDARFQARLAWLREDLRPLAAEAFAPCLEGLGKLAGRCDPERWCDLLATVLRAGLHWGGPPRALFRLGSAGSSVPPVARAAALAEIWHVPFVSGDPIYHFTLLLDVMGEALSSPPWLLAVSLAWAGNAVLARASRDRGWNPPPCASSLRTRREILAAALDSLAALAAPFDFVCGWALARLAPLLADEGLLPAAVHLATENLSDHFGAREDALAALHAQTPSPSTATVSTAPSRSARREGAAIRVDATLLLDHASELERPNGAGAPLLLAAILDEITHENASSELCGMAPRSSVAKLSHRGSLPLDKSLQWDGVPAEQAVSSLLEALEENDDLRRAEALLALAGDRSDPQRSAGAAALGSVTLSTLAREWLACRESRPWIAQVIDWTLERIQHDDGAALAAWGHRLAHQQDKEAEVLLSRIHHLHPRIWPAFLDLLHVDSLPLQRALLQSLCYLAARRRLAEERWSEIADALARWNGEALQQEVYFPEGPLVIARVVEAAFEADRHNAGQNPEAAITAAESALLPFIQPLSGKIDPRHPRALLERLAAAGAVRKTPDRRRETVSLAADHLERKPETFPVLLSWLVHRLESGPRDPSPFCPVTGSLLGVAAAVAERTSEDFRRTAAQIPDFDRCLHRATEEHDSYFGRRAALEILACLGRVTPATVAAMRSAIHDVPECQVCALATASAFSTASSAAVRRLAEDLSDPSLLTAHIAAEMAAALARSGSLQQKERDLLTTAARQAMETSGAKEIWTLRLDGKLIRPRCLGQLADSLTHLQIELSGLGLLRERGTTPARNIEEGPLEDPMKGTWLDGEINGQRKRLPVYMGRPAPGLDPYKYQEAWIREELGARILEREGSRRPS